MTGQKLPTNIDVMPVIEKPADTVASASAAVMVAAVTVRGRAPDTVTLGLISLGFSNAANVGIWAGTVTVGVTVRVTVALRFLVRNRRARAAPVMSFALAGRSWVTFVSDSLMTGTLAALPGAGAGERNSGCDRNGSAMGTSLEGFCGQSRVSVASTCLARLL